MAKYRIVSKGNIVTIKSKLSFGEQINEREINVFEQQIFRGCFRPRQEGKKTIIYTAPDVVPLISYLKKGVEEETFFLLVAQTIEMTKKIEMNGLYLHNLMLQPEMVFVCERTREVFFVYQPINCRITSGNVYAFLADTVQYEIEDIERYIREKCPQAFRKIVKAETGKSGYITNDRSSYERHYHSDSNDEGGTTLLMEEDESGTTLLTQQEDDEGDTTLLQQEERYPILERISTGESVTVRKNIFNIGKEKENDFTIINNKAVSRRHAVIERINGTYYLMDKSSTNHTYLNGEMLDAENSYVLSDHDSIQIADEEFTFYFD